MQDYLDVANSHIKTPRSSTTGPSMTDENPDASMDDASPVSMLALTTKIVAAYIGRNAMLGIEWPALIDRVSQGSAGMPSGSQQRRAEGTTLKSLTIFYDVGVVEVSRIGRR